MNYNVHKNRPKSFRSLTGLTHVDFSHFLPYFEASHDDYLFQYEMNGKRRKNLRRFCIYSNNPLSRVADRLFFIYDPYKGTKTIYNQIGLPKYIDVNNETKKYYFYIKDHLGNNHTMVEQTGYNVQENEYYPCGMPFGNATGANVQNRKYIDPDGRDWYEDKDGNVWKNIGTEYLLFDGNELHYFQQHENKEGDIIGAMIYSYKAVSGRKQDDGTFSFSEENQAQKNTGPIPNGLYSINSQEIQRYDDLSSANKFISTLGVGGAFKGGIYAWGRERVWISPQSVTVSDPVTGESAIRKNFSIHGGSDPGSAGCIDLHINATAFINRLSRSESSFIRLNVFIYSI